MIEKWKANGCTVTLLLFIIVVLVGLLVIFYLQSRNCLVAF